jgi:hypothetical protein
MADNMYNWLPFWFIIKNVNIYTILYIYIESDPNLTADLCY